MRVELLRGSEPDLLENYVRLEGLRPGLGDRFYRMLDLALARLRQFPESAPGYQGAYRRLILRPFHLGVFYSIEGDRVMVGAILDLRQDPRSIRQRLSG
jgi:hypothetical protein